MNHTSNPIHNTIQACFSANYAEARRKFLDGASLAGAGVEEHVLTGALGAQRETLAMDVALLGPPQARALVILSSGVHGPEGFAGSGCQVALLRDAELRRMAHARGVALLLVHAVNPHGFSHLRRTNEDNIDLNRNFIDFAQPTANPAYAEIHDLLLPAQWPPTPANVQAQADYIARYGQAAFREALTTGQSAFADGMFYAGTAPSWSNRTLRQVLRSHGAERQRIAWIDVHTGLGPWGHGEKIHAGLPGSHDNLRSARAIWGADVVAAWEGDSTSKQVVGHAASSMFSECPQADCTGIALEYGTYPDEPLDALRADHQAHRHGTGEHAAQRDALGRRMRDAFYVDSDAWRGMVAGQCRTAVLQACMALAR
jgi:hypothetical protein